MSLPPQPIPKRNASPSLLAYIATAKYQDVLLLYRIENILLRLNIHLPRNTQANRMIKSRELLQLLYHLLNDWILESGYVIRDETSLQALKEPDKKQKVKAIYGFEKQVIPVKKGRKVKPICCLPSEEKTGCSVTARKALRRVRCFTVLLRQINKMV